MLFVTVNTPQTLEIMLYTNNCSNAVAVVQEITINNNNQRNQSTIKLHLSINQLQH